MLTERLFHAWVVPAARRRHAAAVRRAACSVQPRGLRHGRVELETLGGTSNGTTRCTVDDVQPPGQIVAHRTAAHVAFRGARPKLANGFG
jgi:hypothetical protein